MDSLSVKRDAGCYLTQRLAGAQPVREEALTMPDQFDHGCGQMTYQEPLCTSALRAAVPPVRRYRVAAMPQPPTPESEADFVPNAERLLRQGEPLLAYNVADTGLQRW